MRNKMIIDATHLPLDRPSDVKVDFGVRMALIMADAGIKIPTRSSAIGAMVAVIPPRATTK